GKKAPQKHFREAQRKPTALDEFKANVVAVETSPFWDDDLGDLQERWERPSNKLEQEFRKADPKPSEKAKEEARNKAREAEFQPDELKRLKAGVSNGGYHYLGAAKILAPIGKAFAEAVVSAGGVEKEPANAPEKPIEAELAGYLHVSHEKVDAKDNGRVSHVRARGPPPAKQPPPPFPRG